METPAGGKSLNPFDDDLDSELLDLSVETVRENGIPSPVQEMERCCNEIEDLLRTKITDPFAVEELREHFATVEKALIRDHPESRGQIGPCLQYILNEDVIDKMYVFSAKQRVYGKEIRIILFKFFTEVFSRSSQPILIHQQILRPFRKLLRVYEAEGTRDPELSASLVPMLHTMCILMQENQSLLDLFFESRVNMPSQFLVFGQLLPHMHGSGEVGNRARDAILLCLSLADQLPGSHLTQYISSDSNFCQFLATGLSGLYSGLPSTRDLVVDEWQSPLPVIKKAVPELRTFIQALDFCNSVLQVAPKEVCSIMLTLVREGFLQQVMGPALLQRSESAAMFALAYVTIFLTHITNVALMREFLCYLMQGTCDECSVLSTLIQHIGSSNHLLCGVTLEFFHILVDLNCEDVMLELILKYLLPGIHIMPNQLAIVGAPDLYAQAARKILQLLPASCITAEKMFLESVRRSRTPPPALSPEPSNSLERGPLLRPPSPPPPILTTSPLLSGRRLERPTPLPATPSNVTPSRVPLTNLPVLPLPPQAAPPSSTNPFDAPSSSTPGHQPSSRSRSGSDASTSSLVSMSSISSAPQLPANHAHYASGITDKKPGRPNHLPPPTSSVASFRFELISPEMAFSNYLSTVKEAIRICVSRCRCWSSIYDKCQFSKETLLKERTATSTKSLEMEDISSIKIQVSGDERDSVGNENGIEVLQGAGFRSRSSTLSSNSNSRVVRRTAANLRNHDRLHSRRSNSAAGEDGETKMVAGANISDHSQISTDASSTLDLPPTSLRRAGTVSGGRPARNPGSPRFSPRNLSNSQFEDVIGLFLKIVMDKLMDMMQHPPSVNILLTQLLSRLTHYPQPLLRSLLLNHQLVLKPGVPNLLSVLQFLKQTVDRYVRTQDGFEKRLGRARKTMVYRAQVRNSQVKESVARQIVLRQLHQSSSRADLESSLGGSPSTNSPSPSGREEGKAEQAGRGGTHRTTKKRNKKVSTDTLFAIIIFYEFLQELAAISEEQSVIHSLLYLPHSTSLLVS